MDDISDKFDKFFGVKAQGLPKSTTKMNEGEAKMTHFISHKADNRSAKKNGVHLTWEQKDFCTHINQKEDAPFELIVFLRVDSAGVLVEEVRGMDFHLKREYKVYPKNRTFERIQGILPIHGNWRTMRGLRGSGYYVFTWRFAPPQATNLCPIEIDTRGYFAPFTAEQLVLSIRQSKIGSSSSTSDETSGLYDTLEKQLQKAGDEIFIYELLQNASDKPSGDTVDVQIELVPQRIEDGRVRGGFLKFSHTGSVFDFHDVAAICSANQKSKVDVNKIGYKGIGFKTVFRHNNRVEIRSGKFGFAFDEERTHNIRPELPWMTTPDTVQPNSREDFRVDIRLFPRDKELRLGNGEKSYRQLLLQLFKDERPLLFIPRLRQVKIIIPGEREFIRRPQSACWCRSDAFCESVSDDIRAAITRELAAKENSRIPEKYRGMQTTMVMFACRVDGERLTPENVDTSHLYCYLPAADAHWGLPFLMNSDMVPDGNRANIEYDVVEVNKFFAHVAGEKFYEWIRGLIEAGKYEYDSIFSIIPDFDDCVKGRLEAAPFIKEFQAGFEGRLSTRGLMLPDCHGVLVNAQDVYNDEIGILEKFGASLWQKFSNVMNPIHKSLCGSTAYKRFAKLYGKVLGLKSFGWDELRRECRSEGVQKWLINSIQNDKFVEYLADSDVLERFFDLPIFLSDKNTLEMVSSLHKNDATIQSVEKYLPEFRNLIMTLSRNVHYEGKISDKKFNHRGPEKFVIEVMLGDREKESTIKLLKDFSVSRRFWAYIAHWKYRDGVPRFRYDYDQLKGLPFFSEDNELVESFSNDCYSVYVKDSETDQSLVDARWYDHSMVKYVSSKYFKVEEGESVRELFTSKDMFLGRNCLASRITEQGLYNSVAVRFKDSIEKRIKDENDTLGFYGFLSRCFSQSLIDKNLMKLLFANFPIVDWQGNMIELGVWGLFLYDENLRPWKENGWVSDDWPMMIDARYNCMADLLCHLGVKKYDEDNFGYWFKRVLGKLLVLNTRDKVRQFHLFMLTKANKLAPDQRVALNESPILVSSLNGAKLYSGDKSKAYILPADMTASSVLSDLPAGQHIVDRSLADTAEKVAYLKDLGCKMYDAENQMRSKVGKYLDLQREAACESLPPDSFVKCHLEFIDWLACVNASKEIGIVKDLMAEIKLLDADGCQQDPKKLILLNQLGSECEYERYAPGLELKFVSDQYLQSHDQIKVGELFKALGVVYKLDVFTLRLLGDPFFCRYFWTELLVKSKKAVFRTLELKQHLDEPSIYLPDNNGNALSACEILSPRMVGYFSFVRKGVPHPALLEAYRKDEDYRALIDSLHLTVALGVEDGLRWLVQSDPTDEQRPEVLLWVADEYREERHSRLVEEYWKDSRALWLNGERKPLTIKELYILSEDEKKISKIGALRSSRWVLSLEAYKIGKSKRKACTDAFEKLGFEVITDAMLKPSFEDEEDVTAAMRETIKKRMLACVGSREAFDSWADIYSQVSTKIDECTFVRCRSISYQYEALKEDTCAFYKDDNKFIFVRDWLSNLVFADFADALLQHLGVSYDPAAVRRILAQDDESIASFISNKCGKLVVDDVLFKKCLDDLKIAIPNDIHSLSDSMSMPDHSSLGTDASEANESSVETSAHCTSAAGEVDEVDTTVDTEESTSSGINSLDAMQCRESEKSEHTVDEKHHKHYSDDEAEQMRRVFRNDLSVEEMNDINRLDCIRLFNSLRAQGYQPRILYAQDTQDVQKSYGNLSPEQLEKDFIVDAYEKRRFKHSATIETNDGRQIHVIGAINGVAHLPPKWWVRIAKQEEFEHAKFAVCAIVSHRDDGFRYIRTKNELKIAIGDNFTVVRVQSEDANERFDKTMDLFSKNPDLSDYSTYALLLLHSMKADKSYENVFHVLESANDGNDNDYR